ncbi:deacetylvindoline O-acetyltransferase-like [Cynara cardunculus var. scolymus]|uniref:deacetylvindoline O-acetyltransferase-like n=1 Tax=Cynara cardunculus var. scolymus TaxID=59895 RepID=UPI000D625327|nr:deacetylvindoline O-acetyltransferase-like [Cynara cardunculus var. scolymus]
MAAATKANSGTFKPTGLGKIMSMRNNFVEPLPETSVGNIYQILEFPTSDESEVTPDAVIGELRKRKTEVRRITNIERMMEMIAEMYSETGMLERLNKLDGHYLYSFLNKFPAYGIDFGWGTSMKVTIAGTQKNLTMFMASPNGEGIEALVSLERRDMDILQNDPLLLAFCCYKII